ncbi:MAG: hypothetical protein V4858_20590 [Pseudomonadota bacterium]
MTKHHTKVANSTWFLLTGDKILVLAVCVFFAPSVWALRLIHSGQVEIGSAIFVAWAISDGLALWQLHRRNFLRLSVSVPCSLLGVAAALLGVFGA